MGQFQFKKKIKGKGNRGFPLKGEKWNGRKRRMKKTSAREEEGKEEEMRRMEWRCGQYQMIIK